jgi:hypothetical protein
VASHLT